MAFLDEIVKAMQARQAPTAPTIPGRWLQQWLEGQQREPMPGVDQAVPFFGGPGPGILANMPGPELTPPPQQATPAPAAPAMPFNISPANVPGMLSQQTPGNGIMPDMGRFSSDYVPERDTAMVSPGGQLPTGATPASGMFGSLFAGGQPPAMPSPPPAAPIGGPGPAPGPAPSMGGIMDIFRPELGPGLVGRMLKGCDQRTAQNATLAFLQSKNVSPQDAALMMARPEVLQAWLQQNMPVKRMPTYKDFEKGGEKTTLGINPDTGLPFVPKVEGETPPPVGGPIVSQPPPGVDVKEFRKEQAKIVSKNIADAPDAIAKADDALKTIEKIRTHPGRKIATGIMGLVPEALLAGTPGADFIGLVEQVKGKAFLEAYQALKGGGAISEPEGRKAEQALARLQRTQSGPGFDEALKDFADVLTAARQRIADKAGVKLPAAAIRTYNPATGKFE